MTKLIYYYKSDSCDCGIIEDYRGHICRKHYSEILEFPSDRDLITDLRYAMMSFYDLKINLVCQNEVKPT